MAGEEVAAGLAGRQLPLLTSLILLPGQPGGLAGLLDRDAPSPYTEHLPTSCHTAQRPTTSRFLLGLSIVLLPCESLPESS